MEHTVVKIISFDKGCYLPQHLGTLQNSINNTVQVVEHDQHYFKTINSNVCVLINKKDCQIIPQ